MLMERKLHSKVNVVEVMKISIFFFNFNLKTSCTFSPSMLTKERERLETPFKRSSDSPNTNKHSNPLNRAETGTPIPY